MKHRETLVKQTGLHVILPNARKHARTNSAKQTQT